MIVGAHSIIYSQDPEGDRKFFRDVLKLPHVDVGDGWLIFGLPPAEVAMHPAEKNDVHEFYLMCEDVQAFVASMNERQIACGPVQDQGWGILVQVTLPGGGKLGVYQPRHARPKSTAAGRVARKSAKKSAKKPAKRAAKKSLRRPAKKRKAKRR